MAAQQGVVGNDDVAAEMNIVAEVAAGHEVIVIAHGSGPAGGGGAVDGAELADRIAVSDDDIPRMIRGMCQMLCRGADDGAVANPIIRPEPDGADEDRVRLDHATRADLGGAFDANVWADLGIIGNFDVGMKDGGGMDGHWEI
jgi:hypothetical protein